MRDDHASLDDRIALSAVLIPDPLLGRIDALSLWIVRPNANVTGPEPNPVLRLFFRRCRIVLTCFERLLENAVWNGIPPQHLFLSESLTPFVERHQFSPLAERKASSRRMAALCHFVTRNPSSICSRGEYPFGYLYELSEDFGVQCDVM
jgi:hypothetical protein